MNVVVNALPIRPGGGLTVVSGLLHGLCAVDPSLCLTVVASHPATIEAISRLNATQRVAVILPGASAARLSVWQSLRLGRWLASERADALITVNHWLAHVPVPQIVYHLNLLRFQQSRRPGASWSAIKDRLRDWSALAALRRADANVFESHYLRRAAEQRLGGECRQGRVIYAGLPDELLGLPRPADDSASRSRRLVAITSPAAHKDNPTLVRTLAVLVECEPAADWRLDVAGGVDPEAWRPVRELARQLGVDDRITWHGFCGRERLTQLLRRALCLVSTSRVESFAMVALEAMARHCPPIVADCAAMPESVGEAGLLATAGSAESFAAAILGLARQPELRRELVARGERRIQDFCWRTCGAEFLSLLHDVVGGAEHRRAG